VSVTKNLFIDQGTDFTYSLTATDSTGAVIGITHGSVGYTASAQLRRSYYSSTSTSFIASITGGTGGIQVALGATTSSAMKPGRYVWDLELQYPNGSVVRLRQGMASIDPEVTK